MNCKACSNPIDKTRGYYYVMGVPYCVHCYQPRDNAFDIRASSQRQEPESLLEAFRAYQKHSKAAAGQNY